MFIRISDFFNISVKKHYTLATVSMKYIRHTTSNTDFPEKKI